MAKAANCKIVFPSVANQLDGYPFSELVIGPGGESGGILGTVEVVIKNEDGREIQRKLLEVKRKTGRTLGLA